MNATTSRSAPNVGANHEAPRARRGVPPKPIVDFPDPIPGGWSDPPAFAEALALHMDRHGDTTWHLHRAVSAPGEPFHRTTIRDWRAGSKAPRSAISLSVLARIERRYRLPDGYFRAKLPNPARAVVGQSLSVGVSPSERRRLAWHLPDDFDARPRREREEILEWVRRVVVCGSTEFRRFQAAALRQRYAVRFPALTGGRALPADAWEEDDAGNDVEFEFAVGNVDAPPALSAEVEALIRFKTATLTDIGFQRAGVWSGVTALQRVDTSASCSAP